MKLIWTLALVALALAALTPSLSSAIPVPDGTPVCPTPLSPPAAVFHTEFNTDLNSDFDNFDRQCLQFCSRVLCANPQTCGVYTNSSGQRACGCH